MDATVPAIDAQAVLGLVRRLVLVAAVAVTAGCGLAEASRAPIPTRRPLPPGVVALPDYPPCEAAAQAGIPCVYAGHAMIGVLHELNGCIWFEIDGSGVEARVVWPFGYSASFDPFTIYDGRGRPVAGDGDRIDPGGWGPEQSTPDICGRTAVVWFLDEL